jgi:crotonobetainyl-CoA:carnitine CoA-transferase CaiB-like acyl-CoA transferase
MAGPLAGVRIVDMTSVLMGPYCTQILGDLGADVVKVEPPGGDLARGIGPERHRGMGAIFLHSNRSKRSIVVDAKRPAGRAVITALCRDADVFVCSVRPRAMARLGLDAEALRAVNPRLVYASLVGYGQHGPYAARPAYDDLIQGAAGFPALQARATGGPPRYVPSAIVDRAVGLRAGIAILAAVVEQRRSGQGQAIEVPMYEAMTEFIMSDHMQGRTFEPPIGPTGYQRHLDPGRRPYRTADGYLCVLLYNDKHWETFMRRVGAGDLWDGDERFRSVGARAAAIAHVYDFVARTLAGRTNAEWIRLLDEADIPWSPVNDPDSIFDDPHHVATGFFSVREHPSEGPIRSMAVPDRYSRTPADPERLAPRLGEHTVELLRECGYDDEAITGLLADGTCIDAGSRGTS